MTRLPVPSAIREMSRTAIAKRMGVSRRTVQRWIEDGVDWITADELACRLVGDNPIVVFGPDWEAATPLPEPTLTLFDDAELLTRAV